MKKFIWLGLSVSIILMATALISYQNKTNPISDFTNLYTKFNDTYSDFYTTVVIANIEGNPDLDALTSLYSQIAHSLNGSMSNSKRLGLAQSAIAFNKNLAEYLAKTDQLELSTDDLLTKLNTKASAIKDDEIREGAIEISNLSKNDLDNLIAFKKALVGKRNIYEESLQTIIDDDGGLSRFRAYLQNDKNQKTIESINIDLEKYQKEVVNPSSDRTTVYARFQGLVERKK